MKNKKLLISRIVMTVLSAAAVIFIFLRSMQSAEDSSQESGWLLGMINRFLCSLHIDIVLTDHFIRKAAHFTEYTILGGLFGVTMYLYMQKRAAAMLTALFAGIAVAVCDELIQRSYEGRSGQFSDVILDSSGVIFGALIVIGVISLIIVRRKKKACKTGPDNLKNNE